MVSCSVLKCKSRSERKIDGITFHNFPKSSHERKKWVEATGRINWIPPKTAKMCSIHFSKDSFLQVNKQKCIKRHSFPQYHVHKTKTELENFKPKQKMCVIQKVQSIQPKSIHRSSEIPQYKMYKNGNFTKFLRQKEQTSDDRINPIIVEEKIHDRVISYINKTAELSDPLDCDDELSDNIKLESEVSMTCDEEESIQERTMGHMNNDHNYQKNSRVWDNVIQLPKMPFITVIPNDDVPKETNTNNNTNRRDSMSNASISTTSCQDLSMDLIHATKIEMMKAQNQRAELEHDMEMEIKRERLKQEKIKTRTLMALYKIKRKRNL